MADYQAVIDSPIPGVASLGLQLVHKRLVKIDYLTSRHATFIAAKAETPVAVLQSYFYGKSFEGLDMLEPHGTPFQQSVWRELGRIPYGTVVTYGEVAEKLKSSPRAVAGACRANPIPLLVPCHRVVARNGLGGYLGERAGSALGIKQWLLQHEGYI
ncbi:MAG: methylated-DNA--[protein]-cysteine S-methyltransferase [Pseudomonadota bacterium]